MRIGIICNHIFGFQSIGYLYQQGLIAGMAVQEGENPAIIQIKQLAGISGIPLAIINKKNYAQCLKDWINKIKPDVVFVYSFSYKIPSEIINMPPLGIINFHPGNLPDYRGPDPVFWQIRNGLKEGVVTAHLMSKDFDAGPVLSKEKETINENDTYGLLETKFGFTTLRCTGNILRIITQFDINAIKEEQKGEASFLKKPVEKDIIIRWDVQNVSEIKNLVRACNPRYQGAVTFFRNFLVRVIQVSYNDSIRTEEKPGMIVSVNTSGISVAAADNIILSLEILYVQEGCFSGDLFAKIFNVIPGEMFTNSLL